jgi:hypothetical protein
MKTVYLWDSMDDQDRQNTMTGVLRSRDGIGLGIGEVTSGPLMVPHQNDGNWRSGAKSTYQGI